MFFKNYNLAPLDMYKCIVSNQKEESISKPRVKCTCAVGQGVSDLAINISLKSMI